jgi:pyruvate-formate lyase-activating enzyme
MQKQKSNHPNPTYLEACCSLINNIVPIKFLQFHWQQKHSAQKATTIYSPKEAQGCIKNLLQLPHQQKHT